MDNQSHIKTPVTGKSGVSENLELDYWFKEFGITREEIIAEVEKGVSPTEAVEKIVKRTALVA